MAATFILVGLACYLLKYKAGFEGGQAVEYESLDSDRRSGDMQASDYLGTVGVTTSRTDGAGLNGGKPTAGDAATGGQPTARTHGKHKRPGT